ncbi:MAG TPA: hypothetical protein VH643_36365 [Gemmataceae bacterium]|jgi:hypothetical protein
MTKTHYIQYRGDGFWAYDVAQGILLKHLADLAEACAGKPSLSWLTEAAHSWRIGAVLYGLWIEESWTAEQMATFSDLVRQACTILEAWEKIAAKEIVSWPMVDDLRIYPRGAVEVSTAPVVELGRAIISLIQGSLAPAPAGTWWCFGFPEGRTTIRKRE